MPKKDEATEGVALNLSQTEDRYAEAGVAVSVPDVDETADAKPPTKKAARKRTAKKSTAKKAVAPTGQSAEPTEES